MTKVRQLIDYLYINSANCSEMDKKQYRVITEREADIVSLSGAFAVLSRICALFDDQYYVTSNRESGEGRFDIQLMPKNNSRHGILIELKSKKDLSKEQLETLAQQALEQINERQYDTEMITHGVATIFKYGVAFSDKLRESTHQWLQIYHRNLEE